MTAARRFLFGSGQADQTVAIGEVIVAPEFNRESGVEGNEVMTKTPSLSLRLTFSRGRVRRVKSGSLPESFRYSSGTHPPRVRYISGLHPVSFWRFSGRFANGRFVESRQR